MARVELLIDPLRISRQTVDIEVADPAGARIARSRVRAHLSASNADLIRIRMDRQAFRLLEDMEGLADLKVVFVSAKGELASKLLGSLPGWCTDEFIVDFGLLDKIFPSTQEFLSLSVDLKILYLVDPTLVTPSSPEELLLSFRNTPASIQPLVSGDEVNAHIRGILASKLGQAEIVMVFRALQVDNFSAQLDAIFREIAYEQIRAFVTRHGITFHLSPRAVPLELTSKLTLTPGWWNAIDVGQTILSLTQRVIQRAEKGQLGAEHIAEIIWGYNERQLENINLALEARPAIATAALLGAVRNLGRAETREVETAIELQMQVAPPGLLNLNSNAKEAMDWANGYLRYAANSFRRSSEPEQSICESFSDWVTAHPTRLLNQQWNWRAVSTAVRAALAEDKIVVLLVVDALGAILSKGLVDQLHRIGSKLHIEETMLFAPLPTITEIGKLAVATGKDVHKLPADSVKAVGSAYEDLLASPAQFQFQKGWTAGAKIMDPATRLLVFFENQLDDKLHECLHYSDLDAQLQIVYAKIGKLVSQWTLEAESRRKDIEIFITADHGLTQIATVEEFPSKKEMRSFGERFVRATDRVAAAPQGFYKISAEGASESCYYIPRKRVRLIKSEQPFVHGGMTPEEVLIPLISVRPIRDDHGGPISLHLELPLATLRNEGWSVQLALTAGPEALRSISVKAAAPFSGEQKIHSLSPNESVSLSLHLRTDVPQEGAVGIVFALRFLTPGAATYTVIEANLDVTLQPRMLIRGQGEIDFDNMFD